MADWNPGLYTRFEDERTRAAADLLARVPLPRARRVVDLGCGPGNSTALLVERFPDAEVLGIDTSPAMLDSARRRLPGLSFELGDVAHWQPAEPVDLLYANASLHWVPDHERLLPRLMSLLAPGGVLAVQMPDNLDEPSHRLMREVAADARFDALTAGARAQRAPLLSSAAYYDLLAAHASMVDVWRTTYHHVVQTPTDIVRWLRSTGLKPFVDPLPEALQHEYLRAYECRIDAAYPARADGRRLLAFPRLFIVARRP